MYYGNLNDGQVIMNKARSTFNSTLAAEKSGTTAFYPIRFITWRIITRHDCIINKHSQ